MTYDVIIRNAFQAGVPLIDLRLICNDEADYANPIEPSALGGAKIAAAVGSSPTHQSGGVSCWARFDAADRVELLSLNRAFAL